MEKLFVEARKKFGEVDYSLLDSLEGETISLAATIQYLDLIPKVKEYLESRGKKVIIKKGAFYDAHVLGCNPNAFDETADTILLVTDGKFHALNNAINIQREIFVFTTNSLEKITQEDINKNLQKIHGKKNKFLHAEKVGLILTSKYGQKHQQIENVKTKIAKLGKQVYIFETDNIQLGELENFPDIQIWVNTACYGLGLDDMRIINLKDVLEYLK
ncbi:diphthamide synthesis protein [archaeon]|nr:diphthamide synthesis protein [archaeon]